MFIYMMVFFMSLILMSLWVMLLFILLNKVTIFVEFDFLKFMSLKFELLLLFDWMSVLFMSVVLLISMSVILYSIEYMSNDINLNRFVMLVIMFVMSMMMMILSPNLVSILIGWDGLGLVSYCLVIYYQSDSSMNSGMVTVMTNRLGDIFILVSIGMLVSKGSWNFMFFDKMEDTVILFLLMIASFTKSAQIPFSAWLPMAMAAPTPVSALVHSSTLVTAGVYLIIRLNFLMLDENITKVMMLISVITMFLSGLGASFEFDLKKVIAMSTLSQLGVMFFCLSLKVSDIAMFHLLMHAMFKSMLFMCAGVIIHNMLLHQDIRYISMVLFNMPMISVMFNCSVLSMCGIPFLSGFFSKDLILEMYLMNTFNKFILMMLFTSMGLTIMYTYRLISYSFVKIPQLVWYSEYKSVSSFMGMSMYLLFTFSVIKGTIMSWVLFSMKNKIFLPFKFKIMIYFFMLMGCLLSMIYMKLSLMMEQIIYFNNFMKFCTKLWFMPMLCSSWVRSVFKFSNLMIKKVEMGWLEYFLWMNFMDLLKMIFKTEFMFKNYVYLMIFFMLILLILMF